MIGRVLILVAGASFFWLLTALPARQLGGGDLALLHSGVSLLLCLVPAVGTLIWASRAYGGDPQQVILVVLGGTGVRIFGVLLTAWLLYATLPAFQHDGFWIWLVACYLFVLALEVGVLLGTRQSTDQSS